MSSFDGASPIAPALLAPYEPVAEIGAPPRRLTVVRRSEGRATTRLLLAECLAGAGDDSAPVPPRFVREARRIATLASPHVGRVHEMSLRDGNLVVFWDYVDGELLDGTWPPAGVPLEIAVRWILDVLSGIGAIHSLRDLKQQPMDLAHGELTPETILVGADGLARVLHAIGRRAPGAVVAPSSSAYVAPEVVAGGPFDIRADVFGVGALLWEALTGVRLPADRSPQDPPPAAVLRADAPWAQPLVAVAARAMAASPDDRWPNASTLAAEIRRVVGLRLASVVTAAAFVRGAFGETIAARRRRLESGAALAGPAGAAVAPAPKPEPSSASVVSPPPAAAPMHASPGARRWADDDSGVSVVRAGPTAPSASESSPPRAAAVASVPPAPLLSPIPEPIDLIADAVVSVPPPPLPPREIEGPASPPAMPATAVDIPFALPPTVPTIVEPVTRSSIHPTSRPPVRPGMRARRFVVLGGVATFGAIVLLLAGLRSVQRARSIAAAPVATAAVQVPTAPAAPPPPPAAAPAPSTPPSSPPPASSASVAAATQAPAPSAAPAPKAASSPAPRRKAYAPPPRRSKPKSNSKFDPSSL